MGDVTMRGQGNRGAEVLGRGERGEILSVTPDSEPVASVASPPRRPFRVEDLIPRRQALPQIVADRLRRDIEDLIDPEL